ncbi:MAG TPA: D-alanine--D-alanine ligase [Firmicutes bacterium]|nr:D-alanine--D-alanine ligase [Bacillota bacterium]
MNEKKRVAVLFGGKSGEHEVSLMSARSILREMDRNLWEAVSIGISKGGKWYWLEDPGPVLDAGRVLDGAGPEVLLRPGLGREAFAVFEGGRAYPLGIDVVFPILHGTNGEDGTVQGLLELADIPYVGAGVIGSAVGMDKVVSKKLFRQEGIPTPDFICVTRSELEKAPAQVIERVERSVGYPCFVKPVALGSSVGVNKARDREGLKRALEEAALYDSRLIIEDAIEGIFEVECSVLGYLEPKASAVGEIVPSDEFYSYNAKYIDGKSIINIPAPLPEDVSQKVREYALKAFRATGCVGMGRVDGFVRKSDYKIFISEINTIPGFTSISMYPKLWEYVGLSYPSLITELLRLGFEVYEDKKRNRTSYFD